jgi:ABC-type glycerol-3-phosphate transport system permease component
MTESAARMAGEANKARRHAMVLHVITRSLLYVIVIVLSFVFALPLLWMLVTALKDDPDVFRLPPVWIPNPIRWANFPEALTIIPFGMHLLNTLKIAVPVVIGTLLSCSLVAYGFARIDFPGRGALFFLCLATMMIPFQVRMIPLYIQFRNLGWLNTYKPLIVPAFFGGAYPIFMLRQFFMTIPQELSDAARIDGCSELLIFLRIILPLAKPSLAVVGLFTFMGSWDNFIGPLIYLNDAKLYPISVALRGFQSEFWEKHLWQYMMAASATTIAPVIVIFYLAQRTLVEGITVTGIKG